MGMGVPTHVHWHIEVVGLEVVCHLPKALQRVLSYGLLKAKGLPWFTAFLENKSSNPKSQYCGLIWFTSSLGNIKTKEMVFINRQWGSSKRLVTHEISK